MATPLPPVAKSDSVGLSSERLTRLTATLRHEIDHKHIPGVVALIARRGQIAYFEALGAADPNSGAAMAKDSIFRIYSMTKPIVSVAAMMLFEEGRFLLSDPIAQYLPEFANPKVAIERAGAIEYVSAERPITIQDLMRHTSGLTYEFLGDGPVHRLYMSARITRHSQTNADQVAALAKLPLICQPGTRFEYSHSTDVIGRLIEVISEQTLGAFLRERMFEPLQMTDTDFHVPASKHGRLAEAFSVDPDNKTPVQLIDVRTKPTHESGGGGLVSTAADYARFMQMLLGGGATDGIRILGEKTLAFMTSDHLGSMPSSPELVLPGYGFGLGFTVRLARGIAQTPGSVGHYGWGGLAGTNFWVDPLEKLFATVLIQGPGQREYIRSLFRNMVYAAVSD